MARRPPRASSPRPGAAGWKFTPAAAPLAGRDNNKLAGFRHLAQRVDSLDQAVAELTGQGVKFTGEIRPAVGGGRIVFFADLEGNLLHLVERPANWHPGKA
jgi:catechol 2,3-dioxygenase-like lactoylglutathione lyase family enzyme